MTEILLNKINDFNTLLDAVQSTANRGAKTVGYNLPYQISPDLSITYELLDEGPERIYSGQYLAERKKEYGSNIDVSGLSPEERFWAMEKAYRIITVREHNDIVFCMEGKQSFRTTIYIPGPWEEQIS